MKNLTEVVFILDRSGSMSGMEDDTIGGFNSMIDKQKKTENDALITTVLFDHEIETIHDRVPLAEIKPMTSQEYWTRGSTALLDAIGKSIEHIKNIHKYARDEDRPNKTLFCITTDGMENASINYTYQQIRKMVEEAKEKRRWEFLFLGANIDAIETAGNLGISRNRAANFHNDSRGISRSYDAFGDVLCCFASKGFVNDDWKAAVDEDFNSRNGSRKKSKSNSKIESPEKIEEMIKEVFGVDLEK